MNKRLGLLTSGGDAPGMNAAIRAATLIGLQQGCDVVGIERGYRGLLDRAFISLRPSDVQGILREGGTILGSARCREFFDPAARRDARRILADQGIEMLLVIGGNGSFAGALALCTGATDEPVPRVIGIPASIDNDIALTGMSIGVDTAMNTIVDAIDKISDTAGAHDRTFLVEVMGRDCGYLAMTTALATGADLALFPEAGHTAENAVDAVIKAIRSVRSRRRKHRVIVVKAEGLKIPIETLKSSVEARLLADGEALPEIRVTVLGHVVRGGRPSAFDRLAAGRLATSAVHALVAGQSQKMAGWMSPALEGQEPIPAHLAARSAFDPYVWLVDLPFVLSETDKLIRGESPLVQWRARAFSQIEGSLLF